MSSSRHRSSSSGKHHHRSKSSKSKDKDKESARRSSKSKDKDIKSSKSSDKKGKQKEDKTKELRSLKQMPTDPIQKGVVQFTFTLRSIAQRIKDGGDLFTAIDPLNITREFSTQPSALTSTITLEQARVPSTENLKQSMNKNTSQMSLLSSGQSKSKSNQITEENLPPFQKNFNSICIETAGTPDEISAYATNLIPMLSQMKEKAFTRLIPLPRIVMPDPSTFVKATLTAMPKFFSIIVDDPATPELVNSSRQHMRPDSNTKSRRKSRSKGRRKSEGALIPDDMDLSKRTPSWKIDPESSEVITIEFTGQRTGEYKDNKPDQKAEFVFINNTQEFQFGSLLVVKEKANKAAPPQYRQEITLSNPSLPR